MPRCDCGRSLEEFLVKIEGEEPYIEHLCAHCNFDQPEPLIGRTLTLDMIDDVIDGSSAQYFVTTPSSTLDMWKLLPKTSWTAFKSPKPTEFDLDKVLVRDPDSQKIHVELPTTYVGGMVEEVYSVPKAHRTADDGKKLEVIYYGGEYAYLIEKGTATVGEGSKPS